MYDIKDYGAVGDGSTDDTAAVNACIAAAPAGDVVYFPAGNYVLTSEVLVSKRLTLLGKFGRTQVLQTGGVNLFRLTAAQCEVAHIWLGNNQTVGGTSCICLDGASYSVLHRVGVRGGNYGIHIKGAIGCTLEHPSRIGYWDFFRQFTGSWVIIYGCRSGSKSLNHTVIYKPYIQTGNVGIQLEDTNNEGGVSIIGGVVEGMPGGAISVTGFHHYVIIDGVHTEQVGSDISLTSCAHVSIRGCRCAGCDVVLSSVGRATIEEVYARNYIVPSTCARVQVSRCQYSGADGSQILQAQYQSIDGFQSCATGTPSSIYQVPGAITEASVQAFADGDATPSVRTGSCYKTANTAPTAISNFDGGRETQDVKVLVDDANTSLLLGTNLIWTTTPSAVGVQAIDRYTVIRAYKVGSVWYCDFAS